jgi:hypothetical protein
LPVTEQRGIETFKYLFNQINPNEIKHCWLTGLPVEYSIERELTSEFFALYHVQNT